MRNEVMWAAVVFAAVQAGLHGEALLQEDALVEMGNAPLYAVAVGFDVKAFNPAGGATMVFDPKAYSLKVEAGLERGDGLAWGHLNEQLGTTGWDELYLQTSPSSRATNDVRMYSAGFLEGLMTATRMSQFYSNFYQLLVKDEDNLKALQNIKNMYKQELGYVKTNSNLHPGALSVEPMDPYWKHVRYLLFQLWGIKDGYNAMALAKGVRMLDLADMWMINSHGELAEEMQAYTPQAMMERRKAQGVEADLIQVAHLIGRARGFLAPDVAKETGDGGDAAWEARMRKGRCTAFVRLTDQNKDLLLGHTTWDDYSKMTRIFKYYNFKLPNAWTRGTHMGFSSYPGCVSSTDNFYTINSGLAIADTSLEILNPRVYDRVPDFPSNPKIPLFLHVMAVNRMATSANHWTSLFSERNSGTGSAEWIVVDYNVFKPGTPLPDNSVWLLENIPGLTRKQDISAVLRGKGYFASYDRPYFTETRQETGHEAAAAKHGPLYSFDGSPRGQIFGRIGSTVQGLIDVRNLMTRNNWPNEGTIPSAPGHAISARMDLVGYSPIPNGGIDAKVVNRCLFRQLQVQAISGPTHSTQKEFAWTDGGKDLWPGWPHMGLPDKYDFGWVQMTPTGTLPAVADSIC